jgi:hypothetical protein
VMAKGNGEEDPLHTLDRPAETVTGEHLETHHPLERVSVTNGRIMENVRAKMMAHANTVIPRDQGVAVSRDQTVEEEVDQEVGKVQDPGATRPSEGTVKSLANSSKEEHAIREVIASSIILRRAMLLRPRTKRATRNKMTSPEVTVPFPRMKRGTKVKKRIFSRDGSKPSGRSGCMSMC